MPKGAGRGNRGNRGTIKHYLLRSDSRNTEQKEKAEATGDRKSVRDKNKMSDEGKDQQVTNAELRKLLVGLDTKFSKEFDTIKERLGKVTDKVDSLEIDLETVKQTQNAEKLRAERMEDEIHELRRSLLQTQLHGRKYNLIIQGLEGYEKEPETTIAKVRKFGRESLLLDEDFVKQVSIKNAHRLKKPEKKDSGPAAIIVVFLKWTEREIFLKAGKELKDTGMSIRPDLPPVLRKQRGILASEVRDIRAQQKIEARVKGKGIDFWIETRKSPSYSWAKRE